MTRREIGEELSRMADGFEVMAFRVQEDMVSKDSLVECLRRKSHELERLAYLAVERRGR